MRLERSPFPEIPATVVLNAGERAVLRKTSSVLAKARRLGETAAAGTDWEDTEQAVDLVLAMYLCRQLAAAGKVEL